jgi:hypothetical protein
MLSRCVSLPLLLCSPIHTLDRAGTLTMPPASALSASKAMRSILHAASKVDKCDNLDVWLLERGSL